MLRNGTNTCTEAMSGVMVYKTVKMKDKKLCLKL